MVLAQRPGLKAPFFITTENGMYVCMSMHVCMYVCMHVCMTEIILPKKMSIQKKRNSRPTAMFQQAFVVCGGFSVDG